MIPLIYHPAYNITTFGLERLHPFDGRKYRRIHEAMVLSYGFQKRIAGSQIPDFRSQMIIPK
jgi:hypothetical protein